MRKIYKYEVKVLEDTIIKGQITRILTVDVQHPNAREDHAKVCVWAEIDTDAPERAFIIYSFGTGHVMSCTDSARYIGTILLFSGELVAHYYAEPYTAEVIQYEAELEEEAMLDGVIHFAETEKELEYEQTY